MKAKRCSNCGGSGLAAMWYWIEAHNSQRLRVPLVCSCCGHWNWWLFTPLEPAPEGADDAPVHGNAATDKDSQPHATKDH